MIKIMIGVIAVTVIVIGTFLVLDPKSGVSDTSNAVSEVSGNTLKVTVQGEVFKPDTYTLDEGSTMIDLIEAAGGKTAKTDERAYYESATLVSGNTYYIASLYDESDICGNQEVDKYNINTDSVETLSELDSIGASLAANIVAYREQNGYFATIEDIQLVSGIKSGKFSTLKRYIILHE